jgi:putative membrane protein
MYHPYRLAFVALAPLVFASAYAAEFAKTTTADADFVRRASSAGLTEVALGKLAAEQASSDSVKKFAARMVEDHSKSNEALGKLAGGKGLQLAVAPEPAQQQEIERLKELDGAKFDRAYSDAMVKDHKLATGLYQLEAEKGEDPEIRDWAKSQLPVLKEHEKLADDLPPF